MIYEQQYLLKSKPSPWAFLAGLLQESKRENDKNQHSLWGRKPGIFNESPRILFIAVYILHIQDTRLCQADTQLFLLQRCFVFVHILQKLWTFES